MKLKHALLISICLFLCYTTHAQMKEGLQEINGTQLFIAEEGKGEPLIIIHGGPGLNHSYFKPHLDRLAKKWKVVYYDQRACGQSAIPSVDSFSLSFFVNDIEGIRKMLGVEKVNLLAHSWGALLAVRYGMQYPDHVNKMILTNPVPLNVDYQQTSVEMLQAKTTQQDSIDRATLIASPGFKNQDVATTEALIKIIFRPAFYDRSNISALKLSLPANYYTSSAALYGGLGKELSSYDYYTDVKAFHFPVLVIAGKVDTIPMRALQKLNDNLPESDLMVFEKSGHFPFIEESKKFNAVVTTFLKK